MKMILALGLVGLTVFASLFALKTFLDQETKNIEIHEPQTFEERVRNEINSVDTKKIPCDYLLAIAKLESGNGTGFVFQQSRNLFSILSNGHDGYHIFLSKGDFHRVYSSETQSICDVVRLLSERARYRTAYLAATRQNSSKFFIELQRSGYAGKDKQYARKLIQIYGGIKSHELIAQRIEESKGIFNASRNYFIHKGVSQ